MQLRGIHHLTAISARIRDNLNFYVQTMGMRLVKRSVNQDDVSAYHLFYADAVGSPGTDLTFFDWKVPAERRGTHSITRTGLRVEEEASLTWWRERLRERRLTVGEVEERDGRAILDFEDLEGQRLSLIADEGRGDQPVYWKESSVPPEHQLRGLGPVVISVPDPAPTDAALRRVLGMRVLREYLGSRGEAVHVYGMGETEGPHAELHVAVEPDLPIASQGAGGVHHVAFRVADDEYDAWYAHLREMRVPNSGPVDRYYFRSLYFREPNGILFELATDGPGFAVDEPVERLGEEIVLPPFLEGRREAIVAGLEPLE